MTNNSMQTRSAVSVEKAYKVMFQDYLDVVDVDTMREMLGGIGRKSAYKMLKDGEIGSVKIGRNYRIPKISVIAYLCKNPVE